MSMFFIKQMDSTWQVESIFVHLHTPLANLL
jgi:hypothetical protein